MNLPEDLKDYRGADSFQLLEPEEAGMILGIALLVLLLGERLHWW